MLRSAPAGCRPASPGAGGRALVERDACSLGDIGRRLADDWPGYEPRVLGNAVAVLSPLVHIPPRGIWGRNGRAVQTTAERWLGRPPSRDTLPDELICRYLAAYGPATAADVTAWSGLTGVGEAIERLRPALRSFATNAGASCWTSPTVPFPIAIHPRRRASCPTSPVPRSPDADRTRIDAARPRRRSLSPKTFLVDGFVRGSWRLIRGRGILTLEITPFSQIAPADRVDLAEEGMRLLAFLTAGAADDVRVSVRSRRTEDARPRVSGGPT